MATPLLGEHSEYVCINIMNMPDAESIELLNEGVSE